MAGVAVAERRKLRWPKLSRDTVLFTSGLALTIHEAVLRDGPERPSLLFLFAAMMGLPFVLRASEAQRSGARDGDE